MISKQSINKNGQIVIGVVAFFWVVFFLRAVQVQIIQSKQFKDYADSQQQSTMQLAARRGTIYDCKGRPLACDVEAKSYSVDPRFMKRPSDAAAKLAEITGQSKAYWMQQFAKRPKYLVVARRVSQEMAHQFDISGIETLRSKSETRRIYPYGLLASEIVGRTDTENKGVSGLELQYDDVLSGTDGQSIYLRDAYGKEVTSWEQTLNPPINGSDLYLALDLEMQEIVEDELQAQLDTCGAKWGQAIFLDAETGGILSCATLEADKSLFRRCRAIADMNEPGSTAKIVPLVTAFENNIFEPTDIINVEHGRFTLGDHVIKDDHAHDLLTCAEVGVYSSNVGAAKIGLRAGPELIYKTLLQFGFGVKTGIDFPGESPGTVRRPETWSRHELAIICFGYGMSASALQIVDAYSVIASGGDLLKPYFATKIVSSDSSETILNSRTVVRHAACARTVGIMKGIFEEVVQTGTAKKAIDDMCVIAGKTGTALTAQKGGGYIKGKALASFTGYFPADNPRIVGIIMYDEPKTGIYGGDISAPVFKNIAKRYSTLPGNNILVNARPRQVKDKNGQLVSAGAARIVRTSEKRFVNDTAKKKPVTGGFRDFTGMTFREAISAARAAGLGYKLTGSGVVVSQNPPAGMDTTGVQTVELIGETE
jgi:cell division protein FtsI (penicillin-binding protein 3)